MNPETNYLLASLFAAGTRSQLEPHFRSVELKKGQVLAEPLERMHRVYFPTSGIISFLVPLTDGSSVQAGVVGADGAVGALQALDGGVSPSKIVVQMPGRAAVIEADEIGILGREAGGILLAVAERAVQLVGNAPEQRFHHSSPPNTSTASNTQAGDA